MSKHFRGFHEFFYISIPEDSTMVEKNLRQFLGGERRIMLMMTMMSGGFWVFREVLWRRQRDFTDATLDAVSHLLLHQNMTTFSHLPTLP